MKMKKQLKKNSLKVVSLFFAIFLWAYVLSSEKVRIEKTFSLEFILKDELVFAKKPISEVTFILEGPRAFMKNISERSEKIILDLNRLNTKNELAFSIDLNPSQLNLPLGVVVERILPRRIPIRLEAKSSKTLPVKWILQTDLAPGVSFKSAQLNPPMVKIHGPHSLLSHLKELITKPIILNTRLTSGSVPVEIDLSDERFSLPRHQKIKFHYELGTKKEIMGN